MHVLGDPGPLAQPNLARDHLALPFQAYRPLPACRDQLDLLRPVSPDQPREHPGQEQGAGQHEPLRRCRAQDAEVQSDSPGARYR